jgi:hypothetical protein
LVEEEEVVVPLCQSPSQPPTQLARTRRRG